MKRQRRYIMFYKLHWIHLMPYVSEYGLMCSRSWWQCFKLGMRHMAKGKASFFIIEKREPKKSKRHH